MNVCVCVYNVLTRSKLDYYFSSVYSILSLVQASKPTSLYTLHIYIALYITHTKTHTIKVNGINTDVNTVCVRVCVHIAQVECFESGEIHSLFLSLPSLTLCVGNVNLFYLEFLRFSLIGGGLLQSDCDNVYKECETLYFRKPTRRR